MLVFAKFYSFYFPSWFLLSEGKVLAWKCLKKKVMELMHVQIESSFKVTFHSNVFLLIPAVGYLSFTVQNDVCTVFDTRRLFSHSSAESGKFLSV